MRIIYLLLFIALYSANISYAENNQSDPNSLNKHVNSPSKEQMIETLTNIYNQLKSENYLNTRQYFIDLKEINDEDFIEIVSKLIKNQEISVEGIQILSSKGQFGKLEKIYGEIGVSEASRKDLNINDCYGIFIENMDLEVMALWDGSNFKIFRMDNIGKLK